MDGSQEELKDTIAAQADRIVRLERLLESRAAALDAATRENAQMRLGRREGPPKPPPPRPTLAWRTRARAAVIEAGGRILPERAKRFIKRYWEPWRAAPSQRPLVVRRQRPARRLESPKTWDAICFSIIDWDFRWQRPQQLLSCLADEGHRVFVLKTTAFMTPGGRPYEIARLRDNVWEITIAPPVPLDVYAGTVHPETVAWFPEMLEALRMELDIVCGVSIVHVATWREAALAARRLFGWKIVYDCMDEWGSFPGMKQDVLETEALLVRDADLVTVSARRLQEKWMGNAARVELIRNGADFPRFSAPHGESLLDSVPHPIVGYFGAIAAWLDVELLAHVAAERPEYSFVLAGGVFDVDVRALDALPNVHLLGQQPYERMPEYLQSFDACVIPFVVDAITAATDPVKFYEYISLGKPVVSTWLPELEGMREHFYMARDAGEFLSMLDVAVKENDPVLRSARVALARASSWNVRADALVDAVREAHPMVSIVIVSYDNRELTQACIESVLRNSVYPNVEVLVVDNASNDGSAEMLASLRDGRVNVLLNEQNRGFAAANNQALRRVRGSYVVLLNNDTVVPRGWLPRMVRHLDEAEIGLVVAVTNFSGNESRIAVPYTSVDDMYPFAEEYMREHDGERFDIRVAAMYCVGMRREVWERIGPLDEEFGIGMFEDDDYSHRARLAGYRVVCAEDVFVHHVGRASFSKLDRKSYNTLWKRNQKLFETKWNVPWERHRGR